MYGMVRKCRRLKKAQQNRRPVGRPAEYMKEQSYAAVLYGCWDFSKAQISRTNFFVAWESATL